MEQVLGPAALNRATLARQLLLQRAESSATDVVERLVGMQSQVPNAAYLGLWSRIAGFATDDLAKLILDRSMVRISLMRGTVHLVTSADCLWLRPLMQPLHDRYVQGGYYGRGLEGLDLDELVVAGRALIEERPATNSELRVALGKRWPDRDPAILASGIRALVPLVQVPPRGIWGKGGQATHTSAESWLGKPLADDASPGELVLRYLAAFGPATVGDAQTWCGLTRLGEVFDGLRPKLVTFRDEAGHELFDLPEAPRPAPDTPTPARFLPEYDNLLRSHEDRTRVLTDAAKARLATKNDSPKPTFLVDGTVAGGWKLDRTRRQATLQLEPFTSLSDDQLEAVTAEAQSLLDFAAPDVEDRSIRRLG